MDKQGYKYAIPFVSDRALSYYPELGEDKKKVKAVDEYGHICRVILCNENAGYCMLTDSELDELTEIGGADEKPLHTYIPTDEEVTEAVR